MDKKISQLGLVTTPLTGTEVLPIVQGGVTKKVTTLDLAGVIVEVTLSEAQSLMNTSSLQQGATYKITGVYKNKTSGYPLTQVLYDDGTDSGTTVYLQAVSSSEFSQSGWGEFYNPNYYDGNDYDNTDGTGLYGIWDGDNPNVGEIPTYAVDQVVFWGGYAWKNLTGSVGSAVSVVELDATNWVKLPYSSSAHYNKAIDYIEADITLDYISRRKNLENNIDVYANSDIYQYWIGSNYHPISVMGWGLYSKIDEGIDSWNYGITDISVQDAYFETVNFKGVDMYDVSVGFSSFIQDNYFGTYAGFRAIHLGEYCQVTNNIIIQTEWGLININTQSYISYLTMNKRGQLNNINLNKGSYISNIDFRNSNGVMSNINCDLISRITNLNFSSTPNADNRITSNTLTKASVISGTINTGDAVYIQDNILDDNSSITGTFSAQTNIRRNKIVAGGISGNTIDAYADISDNQINYGSISNNTFTSSGGSITDNQLDTSSSIDNCTISGFSAIRVNSLHRSSIYRVTISGASGIFNNYLKSSRLDFNSAGTLNAKYITRTTFDSISPSSDYFVPSLSTATIIFGDYTKEVFVRQDGTAKISYCNNSDVIIVANIDA